MNPNNKNINKKNSNKRYFIKNYVDDFNEEKHFFNLDKKTFDKELLELPSKINKVTISNDDFNIGSKSTRAESKRTHPKILNNLISISKENNLFIDSKNDLINQNDTKEQNISNNIKNQINDIINKKNLKIKEEKKSNNETRFDLLRSLNKSNQPKFNLSDKTKAIIDKIKQKRLLVKDKKEDIVKEDNIEDSSLLNSIDYKYEELVKKPRELPLPTKYKKIYELYCSLENFISLSKLQSKNNTNTFTNFKKYMKIIVKTNFTLNHLKQILFIAPHFFIIKYIILIDIPYNYKELLYKKFESNFNFVSLFYYPEDSNYYTPLTKALDKESLKERNNAFKNLLILLVKKYHDAFLYSKKIILGFDPIEEKTWHHLFNLEIYCKDISLIDIPLPKVKINIYESKVKTVDTNNMILRDAIEKTLNDNLKKDNSYKNKYVSKEFFDKIKRKEEINEITSEINEIKREKNKKNDICYFYVEMLLQIKTILIVNNNSLQLKKFTNALIAY